MRARIRRFLSNPRGNFAVMGALAAVPLLGTLGGAVDYGIALKTQWQLQAIMDNAALAGAKALETSTKAEAEAAARMFLGAHRTPETADIPVTVLVDTAAGAVTLTADGQAKSYFLGLIDVAPFKVRNTSRAVPRAEAYVEISMLIDVSESMNLAADATERDRLEKLTRDTYGSAIKAKYGNNITSCEFACHKYDGWGPKNKSPLDLATGWGIKLRIDVLRGAVDRFVDKVFDPAGDIQRRRDIKMSTAGFSDQYQRGETRITDVTRLKKSYRQFTVANEHSYSDRAMASFLTDLGQQGTGASPDSPYKLAILVTDGVHDETGTRNINPFKLPGCTAVKAAGFPLAVIEVKYIENRNSYFFNQHFPGDKYGKISPNLAGCASPNLFFSAADSTAAGLDAAFARMIAGLFSTDLRLTN